MPPLSKYEREEIELSVANELLDILILIVKASAGLIIFGVLLSLFMISLDKLIS